MKKRFFILFLCLVLVTSTLMVSASAADTVPTVSGVWLFNEQLSSAGLTDNLSQHVNYSTFEGLGSSGQTQFVNFLYHRVENSIYAADNNRSYFPYKQGAWVISDRRFDFGESEQEVSEAFYTWLTSNASPMKPPAVIPATLEGVEMPGVMKQILMILPIVLVCLVGWIGLRKGLATLVRLLRKA